MPNSSENAETGRNSGKKTGKSIPKRASGTVKKKVTSNRGTFNTYIYRVMKHINKDAKISSKSMSVVNSFCNDLLQRLATESVRLATANKRQTVSSREIQTAARLILPPDLAKHALSEATKALANYNKAK